MGYKTQLIIALVYKTGTKLVLRQCSSTLAKYVNSMYLIAYPSILMKNVEVRENLSKRKTRKKRRGKLISQNSFTHLFNIQMTKFIYSRISMKYWFVCLL